MALAVKAGARHSRSDMDLINQVRDNAQSILDAAIELGANEQREMEEDAQEAAQTGDAEDMQEASDEGTAPYKRDTAPAAAKASPMSLMDQTMAVNRAWDKMYPQPSGMAMLDDGGMMPRIMDVFPTYAIVCSNDKHYKVGYSMTDGGVTFDPRDQWQEVQKDWVTKSLQTIRLKSLDETSAVVAGYGVVFGSRDLSGETFLPETNFDLDLVPHKRVYYDHALEHALDTLTAS